jgi:uncharacterized protein (DUF2267 family)
MNRDQLIHLVSDYAGLRGDVEWAEKAITATVQALAASLDAEGKSHFADSLPSPFGSVVQNTPTKSSKITPEVLYKRVADSEHTPMGFAMEHAQSTCCALAELMEHQTIELLEKHGAEGVADLLVPRSEVRPPTPPPFHRRHPEPPNGRRTLSSGRPGSRHPLADDDTAGAQTHSVAREQNPRGDTKISSTTGGAAEREHRTLSEGKPGSSRPVSETEED